MENEPGRSLDPSATELRADVRHLTSDVGELKVDVAEVKVDVAELKADVRHLTTGLAEVRQDVRRLDGRLFQIVLAQIATLGTALASLIAALAT